MNYMQYHQISEEMLNSLSIVLEEYDSTGAIEVELQAGILTIALPSGKQLLVSKHGVSKQLWLSSPISGGLHFSFDNQSWSLADGRTLSQVLSQELKQLADVDVTF